MSVYLVCKVELLADRKSFVIGDVKSRETVGIFRPRAIAALSEKKGRDRAEIQREKGGGERKGREERESYDSPKDFSRNRKKSEKEKRR